MIAVSFVMHKNKCCNFPHTARGRTTTFIIEPKKDYVTGARALGLSDSRILWRYIMPNALPNIITMFGLSFGSLLGGTVVIEAIFGWRGMGFLMVEAIKNNDFTLMQAYVLWGAGIFILVNLAADILCLWLNPKVREQEVG